MSLVTILQTAPTTAPTQIEAVMDVGNWITILVVVISVAAQVASNRATMNALEKQLKSLEDRINTMPCSDHEQRISRTEGRHGVENGRNQMSGIHAVPSPQT